MTYLDKLRSDPRVHSVSDERTRQERRNAQLAASGDGIWVYINKGWHVEGDEPGCTRVHEWSISDLRRAMRGVVKDGDEA